jgi:hypothetical protein
MGKICAIIKTITASAVVPFKYLTANI